MLLKSVLSTMSLTLAAFLLCGCQSTIRTSDTADKSKDEATSRSAATMGGAPRNRLFEEMDSRY